MTDLGLIPSLIIFLFTLSEVALLNGLMTGYDGSSAYYSLKST
jgi:hypothetical protein